MDKPVEVSCMQRVRNATDIERRHCESMANHYATVGKDNAKWHYWYGRKQVCDEVIAQMDAAMRLGDES